MIKKHFLLIAVVVLLVGLMMPDRIVWPQEKSTSVRWEYKVVRTHGEKVLNEYGDDGWEVVAWQEPDFLLKRQRTFSNTFTVPMPRSSISVRSDVAHADFVGTWTGQTTDKPGEGHSTDTMVLHVREPSKSDWQASVSGTFPRGGKQELNRIQLVDQKIGFYMSASDGNTVVWLGLHPTQDDRLIGESFALEESCDGRNIELTRQ